MRNLYIKLYHRYIGKGQSIIYVEFSTIRGSRQPLGVAERIPPGKGVLLYVTGDERGHGEVKHLCRGLSWLGGLCPEALMSTYGRLRSTRLVAPATSSNLTLGRAV